MNRLLRIFVLLTTSTFNPAQATEVSVWDQPTESYKGNKEITVYRSPTCGCCSGWIEHLAKHDFKVTDIKTNDMGAIKQGHGVPANMSSCHTAVIDGYLIEGHVPADDIKRLLIQRPNIAGLAVPQMPVGTPGMEQGDRKDPFVVLQFKHTGEFDSFKEYWAY